MSVSIQLRSFDDADLPMVSEWLEQPRISRWFNRENWLCELSDKSGRFDFVSKFIGSADGKPIAFCQYYRCLESGEEEYSMYPPETTYSLDYFIGNEAYLGKGYGKAIVAEMLSRISKIPGAKLTVVQPEPENDRSRGLLKACGFTLDEKNDVFRKAI